MAQQHQDNRQSSLLTLTIIWLTAAASDRLWFALDHSVPAWDQADYLTGALNYWQILQNPQWFSSEWWSNFWMLSSKIPPLTYILTVPFLNLWGLGSDRATLVHLLFTAILIVAIYGLGVKLFNRQVGIWAVIICLLFPSIYRFRLQFLLDYPLTTTVTFSFYCLTMWKTATDPRRGKAEINQENAKLSHSLFWAIAFGISLGLSILVKQTTVLFLFTPILWVGISIIYQKAWGRLTQLAASLLIAIAIFSPWVKTNWLLILTAGKRATIDSAIAEGDPALNTLDAWIYYWNKLPEQISWPLLLVPLAGLILYLIKNFKSSKINQNLLNFNSINWLLVFWVGAYLINSLNINKDSRYVLPYLPIVSIFLAYCLTLWPRHSGQKIRFSTAGLAILLMFLNLWPIGGNLGNILTNLCSPAAQYRAKLGKELPHQEVITEIINTEPYLRSNLGVLPSTSEINQHNLNYFGAMQNFQVYGRQVGTKLSQVPQDVASLSWFITKSGEQGSIRKRIKKAQVATVEIVEKGGDFKLQKSWLLPDNTKLNLYHKQFPLVEVHPLAENRTKVKLERVVIPEKSPPGVPLSVSYEWSGSWQQLQHGLVLLTWRNTSPNLTKKESKNSKFIHDHGIGFGNLHPGFLKPEEFLVGFQVIERTALFIPANIRLGNYQLEAIYLNRETGDSYQIEVPNISIKIEENISTNVAKNELDLVTQLRMMAVNLPWGIKGLAPIFEEIGRINQYDPTQDYTVQAEQALEYRLTQEPDNVEWAYALAFSKVLQQKVEGAIAALEQVTKLDPKNPNAYAYLAFVHLYNWQPKIAQSVLKTALILNPNQPELQVLNGIAALMQGNLIEAWQDLPAIQKLNLTTHHLQPKTNQTHLI
ncbi:glycosyl transferase [Oscillatoriales cyanobacterium USR001]|nr:glycosyl transferase [Oscillatoriales cyanobacterium USR001]